MNHIHIYKLWCLRAINMEPSKTNKSKFFSMEQKFFFKISFNS